ncbi:hypothetical protein SARC_09263 [Sphaeroforma arctica JP610]|uniref:Deacetylase sirtuin-type domain-containing protein n=1 Tax=Sphaeroforma arctica JP610 TaxID=667725 RepID=A0A0L0FNC4_9EUKA|nr:hypothetical protein SARC_09263 [Sphaeroforma arctica JP610]KNC78300.1 hypothetical protein SARC_09263 [Sphaeroforma arctica JP610]|eukprot:XP_014152202.1 hypothetical protein SARC_09263 [Sphaeroforma arctica JP610]
MEREASTSPLPGMGINRQVRADVPATNACFDTAVPPPAKRHTSVPHISSQSSLPHAHSHHNSLPSMHRGSHSSIHGVSKQAGGSGHEGKAANVHKDGGVGHGARVSGAHRAGISDSQSQTRPPAIALSAGDAHQAPGKSGVQKGPMEAKTSGGDDMDTEVPLTTVSVPNVPLVEASAAQAVANTSTPEPMQVGTLDASGTSLGVMGGSTDTLELESGASVGSHPRIVAPSPIPATPRSTSNALSTMTIQQSNSPSPIGLMDVFTRPHLSTEWETIPDRVKSPPAVEITPSPYVRGTETVQPPTSVEKKDMSADSLGSPSSASALNNRKRSLSVAIAEPPIDSPTPTQKMKIDMQMVDSVGSPESSPAAVEQEPLGLAPRSTHSTNGDVHVDLQTGEPATTAPPENIFELSESNINSMLVANEGLNTTDGVANSSNGGSHQAQNKAGDEDESDSDDSNYSANSDSSVDSETARIFENGPMAWLNKQRAHGATAIEVLDKLTVTLTEDMTNWDEETLWKYALYEVKCLFRMFSENISAQTSFVREDQPVSKLATLDLSGIARYIKSGQCRNIIMVTGAGISTAAGIPDFRSPGTGLYHNLQKYKLPYPQAIFEIDFFKRNPVPFVVLAKELYPGSFLPTLSHYFSKMLADRGYLKRHYTQNIDTLERVAGLDPDLLVEAHGSFNTARCIECHKTYPSDYVKDLIFAGHIPTCEDCEAWIKPDIVFFGEGLPERFGQCVSEDFPVCDLLIVAGTSLKVQPFASVIDMVQDDCPRLMLNKETCGKSHPMMRMMGIRSGFDFESSENIRDVLKLCSCDDGILELADLLGWKDELVEMVAREQQALRRRWEIEATNKSPRGDGFYEKHVSVDYYREEVLPRLPPLKTSRLSSESSSVNNGSDDDEPGVATTGVDSADVISQSCEKDGVVGDGVGGGSNGVNGDGLSVGQNAQLSTGGAFADDSLIGSKPESIAPGNVMVGMNASDPASITVEPFQDLLGGNSELTAVSPGLNANPDLTAAPGHTQAGLQGAAADSIDVRIADPSSNVSLDLEGIQDDVTGSWLGVTAPFSDTSLDSVLAGTDIPLLPDVLVDGSSDPQVNQLYPIPPTHDIESLYNVGPGNIPPAFNPDIVLGTGLPAAPVSATPGVQTSLGSTSLSTPSTTVMETSSNTGMSSMVPAALPAGQEQAIIDTGGEQPDLGGAAPHSKPSVGANTEQIMNNVS